MINCTVFRDLQHRKQYPFQNLSLRFILKILLNFRKFQSRYSYTKKSVACKHFFPPPLAMTCSRNNYLAPVFQKLDNAIHWINHYPVDKHKGNQLHYPVDRDLSDAIHLFNKCSLRILLLLLNVIIILLCIIMQLAQVVQMWNSAIYQILITI